MGEYDRAVAAATRGIIKKGELCTWRSRVAGTLADATKPWNKAADVITETAVRILFSLDELEDRQLQHYLKNTETQRGLVNGMMHTVSFTPVLKDTILRAGKELIVAHIDPFSPGGVIVFYNIEFKL